MGPVQSRPNDAPSQTSNYPKKESRFGPWRAARNSIRSSLGYDVSNASDESTPDDIFTPIQEDSILPQIPIGRHHPVPLKGVEDDDMRTLHTNKFYANAFLGKQSEPIWTHPYSLWWGKGLAEPGMVQTWGMCVSHIEETDLVFEHGEPANSYTNPPQRQNIILTAVELDARTTLTTDTHLPFSVNINLGLRSIRHEPKITFPVVQGMSFITAGYRDATPMIQTGGRGFVDMNGPTMLGRTTKYRLSDKAGHRWVVYVNPVTDIDYDSAKFRWVDKHTLLGPPGFKGTIQVAKNPIKHEGEAIYDRASGAFVCEAKVSAIVADGKGSYTFKYTKIGRSPLLMFILPHHIQSLDPDMRKCMTNLRLRTTTKGTATAVWADRLTFIEPNMPVTMHFGPWNPATGFNASVRYPPEVLALITAVAERDLRRAMSERIPQETVYFAGKAFAKFATIVWIIKDILNHDGIASASLDKLKHEFSKYVENQQRHALYYDDSWKGVVSAAGFTDASAEFGNTYYNDHHFHYAYFVYTAAIIGYLDPEWVYRGDNKAWTNMLVKDYAESDYNSRDYPFSGRSIGGMVTAGPKAYSKAPMAKTCKMWGKVIGDVNMEKRGNLMLAIQARSYNTYIYLKTGNANHPSRYLPNKICATLFENKVDYATYSNLVPELIHAMHMSPITPVTCLIRPRAFVKEEWDAIFSQGRANVDGGWRSVLYANLAIVDPKASYAFFRDGVDGFWDEQWIGAGASRTWYLMWAAAMGKFAKAGR